MKYNQIIDEINIAESNLNSSKTKLLNYFLSKLHTINDFKKRGKNLEFSLEIDGERKSYTLYENCILDNDTWSGLSTHDHQFVFEYILQKFEKQEKLILNQIITNN